MSYNANPQTSIKYSPFYLNHGFEPYFPIDKKIIPTNIPYDIKISLVELNRLRDKIPNLIKTIQDLQKKYHDKKHHLITFKPGDSVFMFRFSRPSSVTKFLVFFWVSLFLMW